MKISSFSSPPSFKRQDEGWYPITFLKTQQHNYALAHHFNKIYESGLFNETRLC